MPRLPADAFFAFFICCPCCTDVVLQNCHAVASEGALEFAASAAVAPAERAALSTRWRQPREQDPRWRQPREQENKTSLSRFVAESATVALF